jgi:fluoroquinolone resistance protein
VSWSDDASPGDEFEEVRDDGAELTGIEFEDCTFLRCSFKESTFRSCSLLECRFVHCDLSLARFPDTVFSSVSFEDSKLLGVNWTEARWPRPRLADRVSFRKCVLNHSTFFGLDLEGVRLEACAVVDADFREARLVGARFTGSDLRGSAFVGTDLSGADFAGARNYAIDARENTLTGAVFALPEAISLLSGLDIEVTGWEE